MVSKNNLSSVKKRDTSILETADKKSGSENTKTTKNKVEKKPVSEKENRPLMIKLTESEYNTLKEKAGITPISSYLKHLLRNETDILK